MEPTISEGVMTVAIWSTILAGLGWALGSYAREALRARHYARRNGYSLREAIYILRDRRRQQDPWQ